MKFLFDDETWTPPSALTGSPGAGICEAIMLPAEGARRAADSAGSA
jgi:hypothetical protein